MNFLDWLKKELMFFVQIKKTDRGWEIPLLATISMGIPLIAGLYFESLQLGLLACISGLVILYLLAVGSFTNRMATLLVCAFGFLVSFVFGLLCGVLFSYAEGEKVRTLSIKDYFLPLV